MNYKRRQRRILARHPAWLVLALLAGMGGTVGGCDRGGSAAARGSATITATPDVVPPGDGPGTTTVSWSTAGGPGEVWVMRLEEGQERRFAVGAQGSKEAKFIARGRTYEFRLYRGNDRAELLASVTVTGEGAPRARGVARDGTPSTAAGGEAN